MPELSLSEASEYAPLLSEAMYEFGIFNKKRRCAFLSTLAHESKELTRWEENLSYSAKRLTEVWPNRFPTLAAAQPYAKNPKALAEKTYGGRKTLGNTQPGDGWKYRGRFPIQATGRDMYRKLARALGDRAIETDPDLFTKNRLVGFRASAWIFAVDKGCNRLADQLRMDGSGHDRGVLTEICRSINGGLNGLSERLNYFRIAKQVLHNDDENEDPSSPQSPVAPPAQRDAESVHEQESAEESQAVSSGKLTGQSEATPTEPESDLLGAAVTSEKGKQAALKLWPRLVKHGSAGATFLWAIIEANKVASILVALVLFAGIAWLIYHNRKWIAAQKAALVKLLK